MEFHKIFSLVMFVVVTATPLALIYYDLHKHKKNKQKKLKDKQ